MYPKEVIATKPEMWYNYKCLDVGKRGVLLLNAVTYHNTLIVGKAPFMCGLTSRLRLSNRRQAHGGRFVMNLETELELCEGYKPGMLVILAERYGVSQTTAWRILKKHGIQTTKKTISYKEDVFDSIDTELKAYVLGLITSDGYIANKGQRYVVCLGSTDKEIPEAFANLIDYGRELYHIKAQGLAKRELDEWRIMVCSKRLVFALEKLGVVNFKSLQEQFCAEIPPELTRHYIRGIYDGDGSLGLYPGYKGKVQARIGLVGGFDLLSEVANIFSTTLGVPAKTPLVKDGRLHKLTYCGNNLTKIITNWLYEDCTYALPRKLDIANQISKIVGRSWTTSPHGRKVKG